MKIFLRICWALRCLASLHVACAQSYPLKRIRLIIPLAMLADTQWLIVVAGDPLRNRCSIYRQNLKQDYATSKKVELPKKWD